MRRHDIYTSDEHAESWCDGSKRWQRMLANQVHVRMACFDRIDSRWEGLETLDLGCAGGYMAEVLARRGARVVGIDPWMAALKVACNHAWESGLEDIHYLAGVGESLPLRDNSVDRVVCVDVLEHVNDLAKVLAEVRRVLRPGGMLFFDTVNRTWLSPLLVVTMAENVLRMLPRGTHDPSMFIRPDQLRSQLESLGFQVSPMVGMGPALGINRRLDSLFGKIPFTGVMYAGHALRG